MNDLTFGATLLSCFASLAMAAIVESSRPAVPSRSPQGFVVTVPGALRVAPTTVRCADGQRPPCDARA